MIGPVLLTLTASLVFCSLYVGLARRWRLLDKPNARSSHQLPTPHGGGVPLLLAFGVGLVCATSWYGPWAQPFVLLIVTALLLMLLGIVDDVRKVSVSLRFAGYGIACLVTAALLLPGSGIAGFLTLLLVTFSMLWFVNLYNFMDGIDGIAASQCVVACVGAALLCLHDGGRAYALFCLLLAASQLGFLAWNWSPARLFMGDAGSIPTGYLLAGLALYGAVQGTLSLASWLILLAVFISDATFTLLWRFAAGQRLTQAHRLHAYQRLSRYWQSHERVVLVFLAVFAGWLFPLAWLAEIYPKYSFLLVILAYLPMVAGMAKRRPLA